MTISKENDIPIHQQLEEMIMEQIQKGILKPGDRAFSEFSLAKKYGISRSTVRNVFDRLVVKNVLMRRAGKGTFVAFPVTTENISLLVGFSEKMSKLGQTPKTKVIKVEVTTPADNLLEKMKISKDDKIIEIIRIRFINSIPFVIQTAVLPYAKCEPILNFDLEKGSLTAFIKNILGIRLIQAEETIYSYPANIEEAKILEVKKGFPILVVEGLTYDENHVPIRYSIAKYRSDFIHLKTIHNRETLEG